MALLCARHGHRGSSPPSPSDVFYPVHELSHPDLIASGAISYFKANFSVTTYALDGTTYIVTINDWDGLLAQLPYFTAHRNAFNTDFANRATTYIINNGSSVADGQISALIDIFGSKINIYSAPPNSNEFTPLRKVGGLVTTNPCN